MKPKKQVAKKLEPIMEEQKAVAVPPPAQVPAQVPALPPAEAPWGSENVDSRDLILAKILLMQGQSERVQSGDAALGDLVNSLTGEKLGDKNTPIEVVPIYTFKTWIVSNKAVPSKENKEPKFEYVRTENMTVDNQDRTELEDVEADGSITRFDRALNFYVMLKSELDKDEGMPYALQFRRTSYKAGRKLATHFERMRMIRRPPAAKSVNIGAYFDKNDKGSYWCFDVTPGNPTKPEHEAVAKEWYGTIKAGRAKMDESDLKAAPSEASGGSVSEEGPEQF